MANDSFKFNHLNNILGSYKIRSFREVKLFECLDFVCVSTNCFEWLLLYWQRCNWDLHGVQNNTALVSWTYMQLTNVLKLKISQSRITKLSNKINKFHLSYITKESKFNTKVWRAIAVLEVCLSRFIIWNYFKSYAKV